MFSKLKFYIQGFFHFFSRNFSQTICHIDKAIFLSKLKVFLLKKLFQFIFSIFMFLVKFKNLMKFEWYTYKRRNINSISNRLFCKI